jgi:pyrroloquinoline quinone biosynthesis protein A
MQSLAPPKSLMKINNFGHFEASSLAAPSIGTLCQLRWGLACAQIIRAAGHPPAVTTTRPRKGGTAMKKWVKPAYCDLRLGFEVTAYVYVR